MRGVCKYVNNIVNILLLMLGVEPNQIAHKTTVLTGIRHEHWGGGYRELNPSLTQY